MKIIYILFLMVNLLLSVDKTGTTAAKFLSINAGAKAIGMGGAFTAISDDPSSMYWNPSGIARLNSKQLFIDHTSWIADISYDYLGIILPHNNITIGINVTSMSMAEIEVTRYGDEYTGETYKAGSFAFGLCSAFNLTDRFSFGTNVKFINEKIANNSAKGYAFDIGTMFNTIFGPIIGVSISNFGPKMRIRGTDLLVNADISIIEGNNPNINSELSTDYFDLPLILRMGISDSFKIGQVNTLWSIDAINPIDNSEYLNMGLELKFFEFAALRFGSKGIFMNNREELFTFGLGINFSNYLEFSYVYQIFKYVSDIHKYSLGIKF